MNIPPSIAGASGEPAQAENGAAAAGPLSKFGRRGTNVFMGRNFKMVSFTSNNAHKYKLLFAFHNILRWILI